MELTGRFLMTLPPVTGSGKNGNWVKQDFVIETKDQYPKKVCITAWADKVEELQKLSDGDEVKVSINIESREYNGKWYTDVKAWKIEKQGAGGGMSQDSSSSQDFGAASSSQVPDDDLPF